MDNEKEGVRVCFIKIIKINILYHKFFIKPLLIRHEQYSLILFHILKNLHIIYNLSFTHLIFSYYSFPLRHYVK